MKRELVLDGLARSFSECKKWERASSTDPLGISLKSAAATFLKFNYDWIINNCLFSLYLSFNPR
jgi:hypothetical protein